MHAFYIVFSRNLYVNDINIRVSYIYLVGSTSEEKGPDNMILLFSV